MPQPLILLTDESGDGTPMPLALEGMPQKNDAGETIHYRRLRVVPKPPDGQQWTDPKDGEVLDMKRARLDEWVRNTTSMIAAGRKPFVTRRHVFSTPDPGDTLGRVERLERDADELYAVVGLHGDDSLKIAARNGRSIGVAAEATHDARGNTYEGEWLHHLAICPNEALPGLERFAASADSAPAYRVFELSTSGAAALELDCGTGAGGFKSGNTCAAGGGSGDVRRMTPEELAQVQKHEPFKPKYTLTSGKDGSKATTAEKLKKDDNVEIDHREYRVASVKSQTRTVTLSHPTDHTSVDQGERKIKVVTVRTYTPNNPLQTQTHTFYETVSESAPWMEKKASYTPDTRSNYDRIHGLSLSGDTPMTEQQLASIRELIGADDVTDETAIPLLVEWGKNQKADAAKVTALSADVQKITGERDAAVLALSANQPKEPDALTLSLTLDAFNTKREQAIASGVISEAGMKQIDTLLMPGGKPSGVALALSGDGTSARPLYARLCEIIAANPGVKANNGVERAHSALKLSGDDETPMDEARRQYVAQSMGISLPAKSA